MESGINKFVFQIAYLAKQYSFDTELEESNCQGSYIVLMMFQRISSLETSKHFCKIQVTSNTKMFNLRKYQLILIVLIFPWTS